MQTPLCAAGACPPFPVSRNNATYAHAASTTALNQRTKWLPSKSIVTREPQLDPLIDRPLPLKKLMIYIPNIWTVFTLRFNKNSTCVSGQSGILKVKKKGLDLPAQKKRGPTTALVVASASLTPPRYRVHPPPRVQHPFSGRTKTSKMRAPRALAGLTTALHPTLPCDVRCA